MQTIGYELVGGTYKPIFSYPVEQHQLKIVPASHVTPESGTGLVHCAPAHGAEDYHVFRNLNLLSDPNSIICHVDGEGRFTDQVIDVLKEDLASGVRGKEVLGDGSKAIIDVLKRLGRLNKNLSVEHRYPYDWKTDKPIIVTYVNYNSCHSVLIQSVPRHNGSPTLTISSRKPQTHSTMSNFGHLNVC